MSEWVHPSPLNWEAWLRDHTKAPDYSRLPDSTPIPQFYPAREGVEL